MTSTAVTKSHQARLISTRNGRAPKKIYRPDIDGLRAISILSVLAFHIHLPILRSGFVGVDIFFVISGFLITRILLLEGLAYNNIYLVGFWARRVKRLSPALLFVVISVLLAGAITLSRVSGEVGLLDRAALATILIVANHFALSQSGNYFAPLAETNPLLHMWSLSVEEQFYLIWPLLLSAGLTVGDITRFRLMIKAVLVVSFGLSCYLSYTDIQAAFFLMPARAWELMMGAILAHKTLNSSSSQYSQRYLTLMGWLGFMLIVYSILYLDGSLLFPGPAAAFPVIGAYLIIFSGQGNLTGISAIISARPLVYIGKLSYPLYLWHWPVLVLMRSQRLFQESFALDLLALAISAVLAILTYEWVEKRSWNVFKAFVPRQIILVGIAGSALALGLASVSGLWVRMGWGYSPIEVSMDQARKDMPNLRCMFPSGLPSESEIQNCYPDSNQPSVLLLGDSHANHWNPALKDAAQRLNLDLGVLTMNSCRPLPGPVGTDECVAFNQKIFKRFAEWKQEHKLRGLIISARWPEGTGWLPPSISDRSSWKPGAFFDRRAHNSNDALNYLSEDIRKLMDLVSDLEMRVLLILSSPVQKYAAVHCLIRLSPEACYISEPDFNVYSGPAEQVISEVAKDYPGLRLIQPRAFMCRNQICPVMEDDVVIYTDDDHISQTYSKKHSMEFDDALKWLVRTRY